MSTSHHLRVLTLGLITCAVAACTTGDANEAPGRAGTTARGANDAPAERLVASGTRVSATLQSGLSSGINHSGETVRASVSVAVSDRHGRVVIPAGSTVTLTWTAPAGPVTGYVLEPLGLATAMRTALPRPLSSFWCAR